MTKQPWRMPEWKAWKNMQVRCYDTAGPYYHRYGGRGITVCERWRNDWAAFYADMGPRPSPKHSLDRINGDGNYEPGNCRWATWTEQANNRKPPRKVRISRVQRQLAIYQAKRM